MSFAQETTITKEEFDKVMGNSYKALANSPNRTIEESEMQTFGTVTKTKVVTERAGRSYHSIFESDSLSLYSKTETISIDGKKFVKKLNNPWIEEISVTNKPSNVSDWETLTNEVVYKSLGEKNIDNKKLKIYQTVTTRVTVKKDNSFQSNSKEITTFYFDENGLMAKSESNTELISKAKDDATSGRINRHLS